MRRMALVALAGTLLLAGACSDSPEPTTLDTSSTAPAPVGSTPPRPSTTGTPGTTAASSTTTPPAPDLAAVEVRLAPFASGLDRPVDLVARPGSDRLYVAEQHSGQVHELAPDGTVRSEPVLDIGARLSTGGEQGLLGIEFSADGSLLYVDYTDAAGDTHVAEFPMRDDGTADASGERELLVVDQPYSNHNGGDLARGPDGMLYISLGDGGAGGDPEGTGQDLTDLLGSILRIDPTPSGSSPYTVPADNPFVGRSGARAEVWQYGLRNPWRFSFDRDTGDLWIGDVGQNAYEEIDLLPAGRAGANFGWNLREGFNEYAGSAPPDAVDPVWEGPHDDGFVSVTGGYVYRGRAIAGLAGAYVFADLGFGDLFAITVDNGAVADERRFPLGLATPVGFAEDTDGELYVISLDGTIGRLAPA